MIAKFDGIPGKNLASLLDFIHSDENQVTVNGPWMIVRLKAVSPDAQSGGTWYGLTLDIVEWLPKGDGPGQNRVDPKYLLRVYQILGQDRLTECVSVDGLQFGAEKDPPISVGTKVKTTQPNMAFRSEWNNEAWARRKWGVQGTVIAHHDSRGPYYHGLYYNVRHEDGTEGCYDPSELEIVS